MSRYEFQTVLYSAMAFLHLIMGFILLSQTHILPAVIQIFGAAFWVFMIDFDSVK